FPARPARGLATEYYPFAGVQLTSAECCCSRARVVFLQGWKQVWVAFRGRVRVAFRVAFQAKSEAASRPDLLGLLPRTFLIQRNVLPARQTTHPGFPLSISFDTAS